jgi:hypothetical protein
MIGFVSMGEVVNLNKYRKLKARQEKQRLADQNRAKNGASSTERAIRERKKQLDEKRLEGHKLDPDKS